ncbi:MAG: ABC transporter ATP-binding protein [Candidatus Aminicenantes bacterium]|nr:ABC transporter ATP-binding protein [Candidatus Aminicenantes bacterium]
MNQSIEKGKKKLLHLRSISAGYNGKIVFKNINLEIFDRDFLGLVGPNGSGKTTLLKVILGLLPPLSGDIHYHFSGKEKKALHIGYLPQVSMFDKKFPIIVQDVVMSGLISETGLFRFFTKKQTRQVHQILHQMGIFQLRNQPIGELSGGQMQRVFLARALVSSPELLILDEPNTFVDKSFEKNLYEILRELNQSIAIIMVSHDLGMIASHVKSIACLSDTLYYHDSNEITQELLDNYKCPIDLITHGDIPHRVLKPHAGTHD